MNIIQKNFFFLFLFAGIMLIQFSSCGKINCIGSNCQNGICEKGECLCDYGYIKNAEGECDTEMRADFIGTWRGAHSINNGNAGPQYNITITAADWDRMVVKIDNLMDLECVTLNTPLTINSTVTSTTQGVLGTLGCTEPSSGGGSISLLDPNTLYVGINLSNTVGFQDGTYIGYYLRQ